MATDNDLLGSVLDALDDFFDQRPGAEINVVRLLRATGRAFVADPPLADLLEQSALVVLELVQAQLPTKDLNSRAVLATDDLSHVAAERWHG